MKKLKALYKPFMVRPIIQQMIYRLMVVAIILLAWFRFGKWNTNATIMGDGFFLAALILLAGAWFNYLYLDGMFSTLPKRKKNIRQTAAENKPRNTSMTDYVDTEIINMSELTDEERAVVKLFAYLIPGVVLMGISLVTMLL